MESLVVVVAKKKKKVDNANENACRARDEIDVRRENFISAVAHISLSAVDLGYLGVYAPAARTTLAARKRSAITSDGRLM